MSEDLSSEIWKDIEVYEGYQVSNLGRVRTCRNRSGWGLTSEWRIVKPCKTRYGYGEIYFWPGGRKGKRVRKKVHHLVLEAFVGPKPPGCHARHVLTNDRMDNRLVNLAWGTPQENQDDRGRHGTRIRGQGQWKAALTDSQVAVIKRLHRAGWRQCEIAKLFGQRRENIFKIVTGDTWGHVGPDDYPDAESPLAR